MIACNTLPLHPIWNTLMGALQDREFGSCLRSSPPGCPLPEDEASQPDETDLVVPPDVVGPAPEALGIYIFAQPYLST